MTDDDSQTDKKPAILAKAIVSLLDAAVRDALETSFFLFLADSFLPLDTPSIDQRWLAPAHAPCPPVLAAEDKPPFEGVFEFPGTGTREGQCNWDHRRVYSNQIIQVFLVLQSLFRETNPITHISRCTDTRKKNAPLILLGTPLHGYGRTKQPVR
ncbi:hypothetical protein ARMGADRAFT_1089513 [Armillaria gallica]|uniref:Uncharacterized protein n=1 Tax=Armillaria gallica TaxID=47427 RepID=A0A2H3CW16_ARMGA|nr:hypothetical protein ARMGADRAFT_1089513 [Armillaria gallica]